MTFNKNFQSFDFSTTLDTLICPGIVIVQNTKLSIPSSGLIEYNVNRNITFTHSNNVTCRYHIIGVSNGEKKEEVLSVVGTAPTNSVGFFSKVFSITPLDAVASNTTASYSNTAIVMFNAFEVLTSYPKNISISCQYAGGTAPTYQMFGSLLKKTSPNDATPHISLTVANFNNQLGFVEAPYQYINIFVTAGNTVNFELNIYQHFCR